MEVKTGAGVIPFATRHGLTCFLFHKTFSGRRAGLVVDFGGGSRPGESQVQTAAREFVEETEAMFFAESCDADLSSLMQSQSQLMLQLIEQTQTNNPHWWCSRRNNHGGKPRDWKTFFVEVEYRDLGEMNTAWTEDSGGRFKKRRELFWLTTEQLLDIIDNRPEALWKRLRTYAGTRDIVLAVARDGAHGEQPG